MCGNLVSGESLASKLGISRVAVWKNIKKLQDEGFGIVSEYRGYRMVSDSDLPVPEALGDIGYDVNYLDSADSTMNEADKAALNGCSDGSVFIAETQTAGMGKSGRSWLSGRGGLYFSLISKPELSPKKAYFPLLKAAFCLCEILNKKYKLSALFKWPNDILVGGKKVVGLLENYSVCGDKLNFVNIGIGVNVHNTPLLDKAACLDDLSGINQSRKSLLLDFLKSYSENQNRKEILQALNSYSYLKNKRVKAQTPEGNAISGIAGDVREDGMLTAGLPDGTSAKIDYCSELLSN